MKHFSSFALVPKVSGKTTRKPKLFDHQRMMFFSKGRGGGVTLAQKILKNSLYGSFDPKFTRLNSAIVGPEASHDGVHWFPWQP